MFSIKVLCTTCGPNGKQKQCFKAPTSTTIKISEPLGEKKKKSVLEQIRSRVITGACRVFFMYAGE